MTTELNARLYLCRLLLNPRSRQVMNELAHPYEMHRTLMRAFPKIVEDSQCKAGDEFGILFRAETDDQRGLVKVYVQSQIEPNWSFLDELSDYLSTSSGISWYENKDIMPTLMKIQNGQVFSFRLRANPTKRIAKKDDPMKGKRIELWKENDQIDWLMRKGRANSEGRNGGFELLNKEIMDGNGNVQLLHSVKVCNEGKQTGRKRDGQHDHAMTHGVVLFDGFLRVTDKNAFLETLIHGIGSGKAFGFGLLSVAPVKPSDSAEVL